MRYPFLALARKTCHAQLQSTSRIPASQLPDHWHFPRLAPRLAFSTSLPRKRFLLQLPKNKNSKMATDMTTAKGKPFDRAVIDSLLRRRFFYTPTADIYG